MIADGPEVRRMASTQRQGAGVRILRDFPLQPSRQSL
jgi:hypothetical protein